MKSIYLFTLINLLFLSNALAQLNLDIQPVRQESIKQGDVFSAQIAIRDTKLDEGIIRALEGVKLFEGLVLSNLEIIDEKLLGDVLVISDKPSNSDVIKLEGKDVELTLKIGKIEPFSSEAKEYNILKQSSSRLPWLWIILSLLIAGIIVYWKRNELREAFVNKDKMAKQLLSKKFFELITNARNRKDYENVYLSYSQWSTLIEHDEKLWQKFEEVLNKYQYRPQWENYQLDDVQKAFSALRGSLK